MSDRPLYMRREELMSSLLGSTTERAAELAHFLNTKLLAWEARAAGGAASAAKRSEKVRAPIREALGAIPPSNRSATAVVEQRLTRNPERYGVTTKACKDVIRDEIRQQKKRTISVPSSDPESDQPE